MREGKKKEHLVIVDSIKGEGRNKDFLFQNQKLKRVKKNMLNEIYSLTVDRGDLPVAPLAGIF